jgi:hypothetical protein
MQTSDYYHHYYYYIYFIPDTTYDVLVFLLGLFIFVPNLSLSYLIYIFWVDKLFTLSIITALLKKYDISTNFPIDYSYNNLFKLVHN